MTAVSSPPRVVRQLLGTSRPLSWINTAYPFAAAYLLAGGGVDAALMVGTLFFLIPYNLLMYGVNDVFDYESDLLNPRKGGVEGALVDRSQLRVLLWTSVLLPVLVKPAMTRSPSLPPAEPSGMIEIIIGDAIARLHAGIDAARGLRPMPRRRATSAMLMARIIGLPSSRTSKAKRRCRRRLVASTTQTITSGAGSPGRKPRHRSRVMASSRLAACRL